MTCACSYAYTAVQFLFLWSKFDKLGIVGIGDLQMTLREI